MNAVEVVGVTKAFGRGESRTLALNGASLQAVNGEMLMIVGPSGCGKTTLLSVICGTLQCDDGCVMALGHEISALSAPALTRFRRRFVGFVFQQFQLIPTLTVLENVTVPLRLTGGRHVEQQAATMLDRVGLATKLHSFPRQLSGGQQQRVAIARALVHQPQLVICDEPTAALDAESGRKTIELLREAAVDRERCVIVVTHDNRIYPYADRIAMMEDGRVTSTYETSSGLLPA